MATPSEVMAALDAFNDIRAKFGGIKTNEQQVEAMTAALEAAERHRANSGEAK